MVQAESPGAGAQGVFACQEELIALYETLVNVMFCIKDANLTYVEVNTAFVRRTSRRSKREVIGRRASELFDSCLLYTSPSPRDKRQSRMPSSA